MKYDYQYKIFFKEDPFDISIVKKICTLYPDKKILLEVQNTKGLSSTMIRELPTNIVAIRVAGGYDEERVNRRKNKKFKNGETGDYYNDAVIYSKNEMIQILGEIEKIESRFDRNWSDIQKLVYIYDTLRASIMYDSKYEQKISSEIRSLRGLITKQTVCAGYAMILKEMMDRSGIDCEYVEGSVESNRVGGHAWNIINIDGKKYPIDLTWDSNSYMFGNLKSYDWLGQDIEVFIKKHYPDREEKTQNYEQTLSQIDKKIIDMIHLQIAIERYYKSVTYYRTRSDGSRYALTQVDIGAINNDNYYEYYFTEILPDGKEQSPILLYSDTNVSALVSSKLYGSYFPLEYEKAIDDILFSKENISDSIAKGTFYIGGVQKNINSNRFEIISSVKDIEKSEEKKNLFVDPIKLFKRSDGSAFLAQKSSRGPYQLKGINMMGYWIYEMVNENGQKTLKRNIVFSERDFFNDNRQSLIDYHLSRKRLDRKVSEAGGYIGYYDQDGMNVSNPNLASHFVAKNLGSIGISGRKSVISIPSFSELKELALKYEIVTDSEAPFDQDISSIEIRDIATGQIQTDKVIIEKAYFANLWLSAAGVKYYPDDVRQGEKVAFCESVEKLYNIICEKLSYSSKNNGVIDTVDLYMNIEKYNLYKYNEKILFELFKTRSRTEIINRLFLDSQGLQDQGKRPVALSSILGFEQASCLKPVASSVRR